jgi:hypothetical protein
MVTGAGYMEAWISKYGLLIDQYSPEPGIVQRYESRSPLRADGGGSPSQVAAVNLPIKI